MDHYTFMTNKTEHLGYCFHCLQLQSTVPPTILFGSATTTELSGGNTKFRPNTSRQLQHASRPTFPCTGTNARAKLTITLDSDQLWTLTASFEYETDGKIWI